MTQEVHCPIDTKPRESNPPLEQAPSELHPFRHGSAHDRSARNRDLTKSLAAVGLLVVGAAVAYGLIGQQRSTRVDPSNVQATAMTPGNVLTAGPHSPPRTVMNGKHQPVLSFLNSSLGEITAEFNAHNEHPKIYVEGATTAAARFSLVIPPDQPGRFAELVGVYPPYEVERTQTGSIVMRARRK